MEEEKLNNLIYLLRIHHIDSEPLENLIKGYKELEEKNFGYTIKIALLQAEIIESEKERKENYIPKSKVKEKIEEQYGRLCMELGSYERDNATSHQERIAGGINELRKLRKELLEGDE